MQAVRLNNPGDRLVRQAGSFTFALAAMFCLLTRCGALAAGGAGPYPVLQVPLSACVPALDGKLEEPCWNDAAKTGVLNGSAAGETNSTTAVLLLRDANVLYIGMSCLGADAVTNKAGRSPSGASPLKGEHVELFFNSNGDGNSFYRVRIGRNGGRATSYNESDPPWRDRSWQPEFRAAVTNTADRWSAELALPFSIFNKNRRLAPELRFNVIRAGLPRGEIQCWQANQGGPGMWGALAGIPERDKLESPEYKNATLNRFYRTPNGVATSFLEKETAEPAVELGPGSVHPGATGEVKLELEGFLLEGDPHAHGIIWDLAVDEEKGELYVLADARPVRGVAEIRVFDRQGRYLRTVMPFNPTLPRASVRDLCLKSAREGGTELVMPKLFLPWGEPSFYGDWWNHPQKMVRTSGGDLIMAGLYRGTLWRMRSDGSLPEEGWTSIYNRGRNEPFESTAWTQDFWHVPDLMNYLPFSALRYPYFCFDSDGQLCVSAGQSARPTRQYAYHYEVGENECRYHQAMEGKADRRKMIWKCRISAGPKREVLASFGGFAEPAGMVCDGANLIVADARQNRLAVLDRNGQIVASIAGYQQEGKTVPFDDPTALAIDRDRCLYVLVGAARRGDPDVHLEYTLKQIQADVHAAARQGPGCPRKLIKLRSWEGPELMAVSGPLDNDVLQIAVDSGVAPSLVWVANGAGLGSLLQLSGNDLSRKGEWADNGAALSCPRQSGGQPILNIDPGTGQLYIEDDSDYRLKKYGTVYRLDQDGKVLKSWEPQFFNEFGLKSTSPWWTLDYERHFRSPDEPLFIDSIFGQDGRIYRWRLKKTGAEILRFDREGQPVPFKATGTHALQVDVSMNVDFWHDVYFGLDVDQAGRIYYVAKRDKGGAHPVSAYTAVHRQVNVYDADGVLQKRGLLQLDAVRGIQVDACGDLYVVHRPVDRPWEDYMALSKFSAAGGEPVWSRPWDGYYGWAQVANPPCHCSGFRFHQVLDGRGYLYQAGAYSVKVIDCRTGKLVGEFGSYGNMDCQGRGGRFPHPELPFGTISALSVWQDRLFAVDVLNRRIVKCRILYGQADNLQ